MNKILKLIMKHPLTSIVTLAAIIAPTPIFMLMRNPYGILDRSVFLFCIISAGLSILSILAWFVSTYFFSIDQNVQPLFRMEKVEFSLFVGGFLSLSFQLLGIIFIYFYSGGLKEYICITLGIPLVKTLWSAIRILRLRD